MNRNNLLWLSVALGSGALAGCQSSESSSATQVPARVFKPAVVPAGPGDATACDGVKPTLCDWVGSVEAIVVGTVTAIKPVSNPIVFRGESGDVFEEEGTCTDNLSPALVLRLTIDDVLAGTVMGTDIEVHVGSQAQLQWRPYGVLVEGGALEWWNMSPGAEAPFGVDTTVGVAISHYPERTEWTLSGELPFTFTETGSPIFASTESCPLFFPPDVATGMSYADFQAAIAACPAPEGERFVSPYLKPATGFAAYCSSAVVPEGYCQSDAGCIRPQQICSEQRCAPAPGYEDWIPSAEE